MSSRPLELSDAELEQLLLKGESHRVERKESLQGGAKKAIAETICAFANDWAGKGEPGVIFVGVKDKTNEASGFAPDDQAIQTLVDMQTAGQILPPPEMLVEDRTVAGLSLAVVTVLPSNSPPVRYKGRTYIRRAARRGIATFEEEARLIERRRRPNIPYDITPIEGLTLDALNVRLFEEEYLPAAYPAEVLAENDRTVEQRLAATRMVVTHEDLTPTVLGVMVLGHDVLYSLPSCYVQMLRIDGLELADPIVNEARIEGTLTEVLNRIDLQLDAWNATSIDFVSANKEIRQYTYPLSALQQLTRNAVMHRTYEMGNAPIRITWFNDRIEIQSPGGPYGQVTHENFGKPSAYDYRNPNLAEAMKNLGYVQRFGVGISKAKRELEAAGHPELEFDVQETHILATVRGNSA